MSEMFDKSQMSETIDVPAGCKRFQIFKLTTPPPFRLSCEVRNKLNKPASVLALPLILGVS